jgi:c-di-GMP-binding flagellar brake protein YcgR
VTYTLASLPTPLKLWEKIELIVGDTMDNGRYSARIEDITPTTIYISDPEFIGGTIRLREGVTAAVYITRDDASYRFTSPIRHVTKDRIQLIALDAPKEVFRVQRRQYVRIQCNERVSLMRLDEPTADPRVTKRPWRDTVAINLSGGGTCVRVDEQWNIGERIVLRFPLFKAIGICSTLVAKCCRCFSADGHVYAGVEFVRRNDLSRVFSDAEVKLLPEGYDGFDHHEQNRLVNYVFQQQIELRKKGLL